MSDHLPGTGPEHLEPSGGSPVAPTRSTGSKKPLLIGVAALAALGVAGAATWAAVTLSGGGPQPSEALPGDTLGYVSVDLDPSAGQKVEALRTLNKFPAFKDEIGIGPDDDIRKKLFEKLQDSGECADLDYDEDIEPWLGQRAAFAGVQLDQGQEPVPVGVIAVEDATKAEDGVDKLRGCGNGETSDEGAVVVEGDWLYVAEDEKTARKVIELAAEGSLADDSDFQRWTGEAGDSGVVSAYAAPEAGQFIADQLGQLGGPGGTEESASPSQMSAEELEEMRQSMIDSGMSEADADAFVETMSGGSGAEPGSQSSGLPDVEGMVAEAKKSFEDFKGAAATLRFADGAFELELAGDASMATSQGFTGSDQAGEAVSLLPKDTAVAFSMSLTDGWFDSLLQRFADLAGQDPAELVRQLETESGLTFPEDAETLAGDSLAIALGGDFDPEAFANSEDPTELPLGVVVRGDGEEITSVLDKLKDDPQVPAFATEQDGDTVRFASNDEQLDKLADGGLGDSDLFTTAVPDPDGASAILFVDFNADWLSTLLGEEPQAKENLDPLGAFGMTTSTEDDVSRAVLRLTTD